jgi:hypothetical protein
MQKAVENGNTVSTICLWNLRTERWNFLWNPNRLVHQRVSKQFYVTHQTAYTSCNLKQVSYLIILLNLEFKIYQHVQKNNWLPDLNPVLLFRCKLTNQDISGLELLLICRGRFSVYMCGAQILPFSKTRQGKAGFSKYALIKYKYCYILDIATDMRIQL